MLKLQLNHFEPIVEKHPPEKRARPAPPPPKEFGQLGFNRS